MNVVFFGTGSFGVPSLDALKNSSHRLSAVVTAPDKPQGRYLKVQASPVKAWALENNVPLLQPEAPASDAFLQILKKLEPDVFVVISFGMLLTGSMLAVPRKAPLNVHASLLPRWRGAAPIHWALMSGEAETGVSVMRMVERLDAGDVLVRKSTPILPEDDIYSLESRLELLGAEALLEGLAAIEAGAADWKPQDDTASTYARKIKKEDGRVDWKKSAAAIVNQVRALKAWPTSYSFYYKRRVIIHEASVIEGRYPNPGSVVYASAKDGICIAAGEGGVGITRLQLEGKGELDAREFVKGFPLITGALFE